MKSNIQDKNKLVNSVFTKVHKNYDLMNDIMSLGIHRVWKKKFIDWMNPQPNTKLIDVASGTGDIAKLFFNHTNARAEILCLEPNTEMYKEGKIKLNKIKNIKWINAMAEKIPEDDNTFDYYTISYGLRNVSEINKALKEAYRVLKPGGRFMCLEFSKIDNEMLNFIYKQYSKVIPLIGLSQKLSIGGGSQQSNGKQLLTMGNGEYAQVQYKGREYYISVAYGQKIPLPFGVYTLYMGASYRSEQTNFNFSEIEPTYTNYKFTEEAIIPFIALRYRVLNIPNLFSVYTALGSQMYLSQLNYSYEENLFSSVDLDYNFLLPFLEFGIDLQTSLFSITPFIKYQIEPIFFDDINDIESSDINNALSSAGLVTGVSFEVRLY